MTASGTVIDVVAARGEATGAKRQNRARKGALSSPAASEKEIGAAHAAVEELNGTYGVVRVDVAGQLLQEIGGGGRRGPAKTLDILDN